MKKIMSLFQRNYTGDRKVRDEVTPGAEWVLRGEGNATRKRDGVAVLIDNDGDPFMRYDAKTGRTPPEGFIPAQPEPDPVTGHWPGWVTALSPAGKWIIEAMNNTDAIACGKTYEVCGPKIGTRHGPNPEKLDKHVMFLHGSEPLDDCPRTYEGIMEYLRDKDIEGIVFWHGIYPMVKIKKADFPYGKPKEDV